MPLTCWCQGLIFVGCETARSYAGSIDEGQLVPGHDGGGGQRARQGGHRQAGAAVRGGQADGPGEPEEGVREAVSAAQVLHVTLHPVRALPALRPVQERQDDAVVDAHGAVQAGKVGTGQVQACMRQP